MLTMMHQCRRAFSNKQNTLNTQNSNRKAKVKPCMIDISVPYHSSVCSNNKTAKHYIVPPKTKRLKTRKQRNQFRKQISNRFNQHHHQQHYERKSKDKSQCSDYQDWQCSLHFSRKEKPVDKPLSSQKPSIITEGRITSIKGLFSHEVRSVDIERLVKETKHPTHIAKGKEKQATASNLSCVIPHSISPAVVFETSEEGISAWANKDLNSKSIGKKDNLQTNLDDTVSVTMHSGDGNHSSTQTLKDKDNTARFLSPQVQKVMQEAVIMSSLENYPVCTFFSASFKLTQSDHKILSKTKNTYSQKQTNKVAAAMDVQDDFVNSEKRASPVGIEASNLEVPQFDHSPTIILLSSPTMDGEKRTLGDESQHKKPVFSKEKTVSRLAARLCHNLGPFPQQHCCPPLTSCKKVLFHHLRNRHGSLLQHSLRKIHTQLRAPGLHFPHITGQAWPSTVQKYLDNTQISLSYSKKHEDNQQTETMEFQTDNSPQKHSLRVGFCENVDRGGASEMQRTQPWGIYSPEDFVIKLQRPCKDMLSQWSITAQSPESLRAKRHSNSQTFSLHQTFTKTQTPPWYYSCTDRILDPFLPEPEKQVKLASGENRRRNSPTLPLLEQWRNDPDLNFLFQDEYSRRTHTSLGPLAEFRNQFPKHDIKRISERQLFGASSTVSAFFPPKGFCYEPYYRFSHPSDSFSRSEESKMSLYIQPDSEKRGCGPFLHLTSPNL